ncbi:MAG: acetyl-CoA hydrolase/transferase C-terminal domain-containing protein, partial [Bdellovibrionia bacterium]
PCHYADSKFKDNFKVTNLFVGSNVRARMDFDRVDYLPCFLSEIPQLFLSKRKRIDVAILQLSPPDKHGFCTLGTSVDVARAAFEAANVVVAQVNRQMPRVHGDGFIHIGAVDRYIEVDVPLYESKVKQPSATEAAIGKYVSELIEDGSCLQAGIGAIPDAVLGALKGHRNLGVHSEMWSDGVLDLINSGAVDNSRKAVHPGKCISGFIIGSRKVYDFINDNPAVVQLGIDYVNSPTVIARNSKVAAINSAVEIDLTGQVCADSVGSRIISGVGGQMDFMRGASLSKGGKPIIAITSRTKTGRSRITCQLQAGAGVVTTRSHVHFVVTEYGSVDLAGKTLGERAKSLIQIAHPEDRERLLSEWKRLNV